jgi:L-ascorbate metabolism protein UlaG (beta-lactamase superfamily)
MDPVERSSGFGMGKQSADIVTLSNDPLGRNLGAIRPEFKIIDGPGEYEMNDVFITGARTYQDEVKGEQHGYNTIYVVETEGLKIGHLGNVGHTLSESQAEPLEALDILIVPIGGDEGFTYDKAIDIVTKVEPKVVIPMRYATPIGGAGLGDVQVFSKKLGVEMPPPEDRLTIKRSDLGETMRLIVLNPDSDPVKR